MFRLVSLAAALSLSACSGSKEEALPAPVITWLAPLDGDNLTAGDIACSLVVDNFTLASPLLHNEGQPIGYLSIDVDDNEVLQTGDTNFTVTLDAGSHEVMAHLVYTDGDDVSATDTELCDEEDTSGDCSWVMEMVTVTVQ